MPGSGSGMSFPFGSPDQPGVMIFFHQNDQRMLNLRDQKDLRDQNILVIRWFSRWPENQNSLAFLPEFAGPCNIRWFQKAIIAPSS